MDNPDVRFRRVGGLSAILSTGAKNRLERPVNFLCRAVLILRCKIGSLILIRGEMLSHVPT